MSPALRVVYPYGGRVLLLHWWTYNDRGHIVIARNELAIVEVARRVFSEHPDAEIKGYAEVEIVAPSERLQKLAAHQQLEKDIGSFFYEIVHRMREAVEAGKTLPPMFELCTKFEPAHEDSDPDEWSVTRHYDCKHCQDTIRLVGMTRGDLYARYHERWVAADPDRRPEYVDKKRVESRARVARDDERICRIGSNFGPHSEGLLHQDIHVDGEPTLATSGMLGYGSLEDDALFYYVPGRDLDPSHLQVMLTTCKKERKREHDRLEKQQKKDHERAARDRIDSAVAFFTEAP